MWKGAGGELTALVSFLPFNCAALPVTAPLNWRGHTLPGPSQWDGLGEMKFIYLFTQAWVAAHTGALSAAAPSSVRTVAANAAKKAIPQ
jgi:hypothetical protein